jgi:hypothetical protein
MCFTAIGTISVFYFSSYKSDKMKSNTHINRPARFLTILGIAVLLGTALKAQQGPETLSGFDQAVIDRLENLMAATEQNVRYDAPDAIDADQLLAEENINTAFHNLEILACATENEIVYRAPSGEVEAAFLDLDLMAGITEKNLQYTAPLATDQLSDGPVCTSEQYAARNAGITQRKAIRMAQVETTNYTPQEIWLIKAGYVKPTGNPAWARARRAFRTKSAIRTYAAQL